MPKGSFSPEQQPVLEPAAHHEQIRGDREDRTEAEVQGIGHAHAEVEQDELEAAEVCGPARQRLRRGPEHHGVVVGVQRPQLAHAAQGAHLDRLDVGAVQRQAAERGTFQDHRLVILGDDAPAAEHAAVGERDDLRAERVGGRRLRAEGPCHRGAGDELEDEGEPERTHRSSRANPAWLIGTGSGSPSTKSTTTIESAYASSGAKDEGHIESHFGIVTSGMITRPSPGGEGSAAPAGRAAARGGG